MYILRTCFSDEMHDSRHIGPKQGCRAYKADKRFFIYDRKALSKPYKDTGIFQYQNMKQGAQNLTK